MQCAKCTDKMENEKLSAIDLEYLLLGTCMVFDCFYKVEPILNDACFSNRLTKGVWACLKELHKESGSMNPISVTERFKKKIGIKGDDSSVIFRMTSEANSDAKIEYNARVLMQYAIDRQLRDFGQGLCNKAGNGDSLDALDLAQTELHNIATMAVQGKANRFDDTVVGVVETIGKRMAGIDVLGIPTALKDLDLVVGGWKAPDLIVIAARPGMGKTAFMLQLAKQAAKNSKAKGGGKTAIFSLEMSDKQLTERLLVSESMIDNEQIKRGKLSQDEYVRLMQAGSDLTELQLHIDDTPSVTVSYIRSVAMKLQHESGLEMIVVDYIQLMRDPAYKHNREQEISSISRELKALGKSLNVPVIALAQLSRAVETRGGDKRPMLSDLRESGAIEQDADMVIFLYRPEYYGITEDEDNNPVTDMCEAIIAKNRNGWLGNVPMKCRLKYFAFSDWNGGNDDLHDTPFTVVEKNAITQGNYSNNLEPNF